MLNETLAETLTEMLNDTPTAHPSNQIEFNRFHAVEEFV